MKSKIASITVLYNPEEGFQENIASYAEEVDEVIIVNNSTNGYANLPTIPGVSSNKLHIIHYGQNMGVAHALNDGTRKAIELGADWILTMDQDSSFTKLDIRQYLAKIPLLEKEKIFITGPDHDDEKSERKSIMEEVDSVITSGCLFKKEVFNLTGGFNDKLFIDEVDHEFCFHAKSLGVNIFQINDTHLIHQLGKGKWVNVPLKKKSKRIFHNPHRLYFMVRNGLYLQKKYKDQFPVSIRKKKIDLLHRIKNNLIFGDRKLEVMSMIIKGYLDFRNKKFGNPFE